MLNTLKNAWNIPDLRKKMVFTIMMLFVFRVGAFIPVPGIDSASLNKLVSANDLASFYNIISGGAFSYATIFAMSVTPYINSSIILQLLTVAIPSLEKLSKEGEEGRKKIGKYTRYLTIVLGAIQAIGLYVGLKNWGVVKNPGIWSAIVIILAFTAGTAFLMWVGEKITEHGIGNGISLLIFTGIVSRIPSMINSMYQYNLNGKLNIFTSALIVLVILAVIACVVFFDKAERRIPVQYPRRVVGRTAMGGQVSHMPIKVNIGGVIPIIFAMSIMQIPYMLKNFMHLSTHAQSILSYFQTDSYGAILYVFLIVFFTYFYAEILFNTEEIAENMQKNGAFIPGIRQGKSTVEFLSEVLSRVTFIGAIFLVFVSMVPEVAQWTLNMSNLFFGSTSLLIVVGVALETVRQLESQMTMRHYRGFLD